MPSLNIIASPGNGGIRFEDQTCSMKAHANLTTGVTRYLVYAVDAATAPTVDTPEATTLDMHWVDLVDAGDELDDIMVVALEDSAAAGDWSRFAYSGRVKAQLGQAAVAIGAPLEVATDGQLVAATQDSRVVAISREAYASGGDGANIWVDFFGSGTHVKSDA